MVLVIIIPFNGGWSVSTIITKKILEKMSHKSSHHGLRAFPLQIEIPIRRHANKPRWLIIEEKGKGSTVRRRRESGSQLINVSEIVNRLQTFGLR
jgi:hypothetical protein